jgi:hypothetical protein
MDCSTAASICASWPIAPSGVRGYPVMTKAGPCTALPAGMLILGPSELVCSVARAASGGTSSIGAAAIASRRCGPASGRDDSSIPAGWALAVLSTPENAR